MSADVVLIDDPAPQVRRVTLNRPEKRNALNHALRGGIIHALQAADADPSVRVMIVRGAGKCFSAGYELGGGNAGQELPWYTPGGDGHWPRSCDYKRAGPGCLNRFSASISGASAGVRLPSGGAAG